MIKFDQHSKNGMLKPILDCQPAELLRACYEQATDVGIDEVRAFLAQRPTDVLAHDYVSWGGLVEMLLRDVFNRKMVQDNDLHCVHDYLDSVSGWFGQQDPSNADWLELLRAVAGLLDGQGMKSPESMQRDALDIQGTPDLFG